MTNLANLDRTAHQTLRVDEELALSACKDITMCAVTPTEIPRLVIEYPVVFTKNGEGGEYVCVALFGVDPQKNLFWRENRWQSFSLPLNIGRQPFFVGVGTRQEGDAGPALVTFIDLDNPGVQSATGSALFDGDGKESPYLRHKMNQLAELIEGESKSRAFVDRLVELQLIRPIQLELKAHGAEPRKIGGLFTIDENRLRALAPDILAELNGKGYLHVMYAMLSSLGQLQILARRAAAP